MCGVASHPLGVVDGMEVDARVASDPLGVVDGMEVGGVEVAEMVCEVEVESDSQKIRNVQQG